MEMTWLAEIKDINSKLTGLAVGAASRRDCPSPGLCLQLKSEIGELWVKNTDAEKRIASLEKWQAGTMAVVALLMVLLTIFGPAIRALVHAP